MLTLDALLLARIQFAFTISFHIIFPAFSIGLASFLAVLEWIWLKTGDIKYKELYKFWVKIFAVSFGMGVVSGIPMSYQFGTNWSVFSDHISNVIGPLFNFEILTAFFLEASFLGIMLFGWDKVGKKMHFASTCIVSLGTLMSAFWIVSANSWMQTPQGFEVGVDGRFYPTDWLKIIFNPSLPYRYVHMVMATYIATAFVVGGVGAFYLWNKKHIEHAKVMLGMAVLLVTLFVPTQLFIGDMHGINTLEHQPVKIAAMEGLWETEKGAGLRLFAIPDQEKEVNHYEVIIPKVSSLILTHSLDGEVKGLKEWSKEDRPNVPIVFWCFRIMVGIGLVMLSCALISAAQYFRGKLFESRLVQIFWMIMMPSGFIAILSGWFVTETGRQPYTVYGVLRTIKSVSPSIQGEQVLWSLIAFIVTYALVFGSSSYYILKLIRKGIVSIDDKEQFYDHGLESSSINRMKAKKVG